MTATNPATCDCPQGDLDTSPGMCYCGEHYLSDGSTTIVEQDGGQHSKYRCIIQWDPLPECEVRANR